MLIIILSLGIVTSAQSEESSCPSECKNDEDCLNVKACDDRKGCVDGQCTAPAVCPDGAISDHAGKRNECDRDGVNCQGYVQNASGNFVLRCGRGYKCLNVFGTNYKRCVEPPSSPKSANWRESLANTITGNILKTVLSIVNYSFLEWIKALTGTKTFITGNYSFAQKYYESLCYSVNGCKKENAFDYIEDNSRLNINSPFVKENKVTTYQLPYDLLPYSLFQNTSFNNYGVRLGAEQMANNLIFDDSVKQLNMAKAKDLLALLFNDIDYYMQFYNSLFSESLINSTVSKLYTERVPFKISPSIIDENDMSNVSMEISLLSNLQQESTRRFSDFKWRKKISSSSKLALYRELAIMLSHKLNVTYRQNFILSKVSLYKLNWFLNDAIKADPN